MIKSRLAAAAILAVLVAHAQTIHPARSPYDRRGLYHATIHGRVISPTGEPVPGVHLQLVAGRPGSLPLIDAVTAADGRFTMTDVNSFYAPTLIWYPPDGWAQGATPVAGESYQVIEFGDIRVEPGNVIRARVEFPDVTPLLKAIPQGRIAPAVTLERSPSWGPQPEVERIGDEFVFRDTPLREGVWRVRFNVYYNSEEYTAPFHAQPGKRTQSFTLRLLRDPVITKGHTEGKIEVSENSAPLQPLTREFTITGRVVAPDNSPIEGAIVSSSTHVPWTLPKQRMRQWTLTGPDGQFTLTYRASNCARPEIAYGDATEWNLFLSKPNMRDIPCEDWLNIPQTVVMPYPSRLAIRVTGIDPSKVHAGWWHGSFGWQRFSTLRPWFPASGNWYSLIRVMADGYLPMVSPVRTPRFDPSKQEPPSELPLQFHFDSSVQRTLAVVSAGKPVAGATVDLESIEHLDSDQRVILATYRLPSDGKLKLLGGRDQLVEVFVYAKGFEPKRAIWNPGAPLVIDLAAHTSTLEFPASSSITLARMRKADLGSDLRSVTLHSGKPTRVQLAPGTYDVTCHAAANGSMSGYQRIAATPTAPSTVDCSADQRPRLTVVLPGPDWRLYASRAKPPGGVAQWDALRALPGKPELSSEDFDITGHGTDKRVVVLPSAGRWNVSVHTQDRKVELWREVNLQAGESATIAVPTSTGTLKASTRTFNGGLERFNHGIATPRLQLIAADPNNWSFTRDLPERDATEGEQRNAFTLTGIPAGNYHLYHHLIGKPETFDYGSGPVTSIEPIDAWGGIPVKVEANSTTQLRDLIDYPFAELQVRVTDAQDRPVEHATVRIRDRMSESWRQTQERPRLFGQPAHPIPYPPAARIVNGRASLPNIREGWLELLVEPDSGPIYSFTVPVSPDRQLELKVPH